MDQLPPAARKTLFVAFCLAFPIIWGLFVDAVLARLNKARAKPLAEEP